MDGWSTPVLVQELLTFYRSSRCDARPTPYRDYLAWIAAQDRDAAVAAWRAALAGGVTDYYVIRYGSRPRRATHNGAEQNADPTDRNTRGLTLNDHPGGWASAGRLTGATTWCSG